MTEKIVFLTICLLPLYVLRGKIGVIPTTLLEVLVALSTFFWVYDYFRQKVGLGALLKAFKTPLFLSSVIFLVVSLTSLLFSPDLFAGFGLYRAYILEPWLLFVISVDVFKGKPERLVQALIFSALLLSSVALLQAFTRQPFFEASRHELLQGRVSGFYNTANALALYIGPLLSLLLLSLFKTTFWIKKSWAILIIFVFLVVLSLTNSLGAILGLALVSVLYSIFFLIRKNSTSQKLFFKGVLALVVLICVLYFTFLASISHFAPKGGLTYPRPYGSTEIVRVCLWEGARDFLLSHPQGGGLSGFPNGYEKYRTCDTELFQYPHNLFLNFWTEVGLLGLLAFLYLIFSFIRMVMKSAADNLVKLGLLSYLIYLFVHGMVDVPYFKNDLSAQFWVYLAFGILLVKNKEVLTEK